MTAQVASPDDILERLELDRAALVALCRATGVRRLAIFGSAVRENFNPESSDLDVLVTLVAPTSAIYADRYFMLKEGLERLVARPVDLVTEPSITNPYLARRIAAEQVTLYASRSMMKSGG